MSIHIEGQEELDRKLKELAASYGRKMADALNKSVLDVHATAVKSIQEKSPGRLVTRTTAGGNSYSHVAAAEGNAPNTDTGKLVSSIKFQVNTDNGIVFTKLEYGKSLEFGTMTMGARPWLIPALESNRAKIKERFKKAVS